MLRTGVFAGLVLVAQLGWTAQEWSKGFVEIENGRRLYVEHKVAAPGMKTLVLLNGLTYSTSQWRKFVQHFEKIAPGYGLVVYDMHAMGKTQLSEGPTLEVVPYQNQVRDLHLLLDALGLGKGTHLLGLSYGGAIGLEFVRRYPERVDQLIAVAPFVAALPAQDYWIRTRIRWVRINPLNPFNFLSDDQLYDYFLREHVTTFYPPAEPVIFENPYKLEGVIRMVQGVRKFSAFDAVQSMPPGKVHFAWAVNDEYLDPKQIEDFLKVLPDHVPSSQVIINDAKHKVPEQLPGFLAAWSKFVLDDDPLLKNGNRFVAEPYLGFARSFQGSLYFPKEKRYPWAPMAFNWPFARPHFEPWSADVTSCTHLF